ncbi:MAG: hypothetical protein KME52_13060 [Desmonostoc geniculatum HA4340-LM1]|jgi:hypothetical protein|nr:hypothetical protein [Desmonostoc geniculatum HA4340-LM1]
MNPVNFARKLYTSTVVACALLLSTCVSLEATNKVPQGTTENSTKAAVVMIDKTRRMYLDAKKESENSNQEEL